MLDSFTRRRAPLLCLLLALCAGTVQATTILQQQRLPDLVEGSARAVTARVVAVRYGYDENRLPSTRVTLEVEDAIYGEGLPAVGDSFVIKLFGAPETMPDGMRYFLNGTPRYRAGERYLLLLIGESEWGFTNTVGLPFGAFRVKADGGAPMAQSMAGNRLALGAAGLGTWLPEGSAERAAAPSDPAAGVPLSLLRTAIVGLRDAR